jgi:hypothetical protein
MKRGPLVCLFEFAVRASKIVKERWLLYIVILFLASVVASAPPVEESVDITIAPERVLIEQGSRDYVNVNFDFHIFNRSKTKLVIDSITLTIFNNKGEFEKRQVLDRHGVSPAILTIPSLETEAGSTLNVYNPFYSFDRSIELGSLVYEFEFTSAGGQSIRKSVSIRPTIFRTKSNLILPLSGRVVVEAGHGFYSPHRRIDLTNPLVVQVGLKANSARFANDLTIADSSGRLFSGSKDHLENWYAYGAALYSPGSGRVVAMANEVPENKMKNGSVVFSDAVSYEKTSGIFGNYIIIDHGTGEFSLFAHLKLNSFKVKTGDVVRQGQELARIGFSGDADFVHAHYQLQNGPDPRTAEGLPAEFNHFTRLMGSRRLPVSRGPIDSGDIVTRQ